MAKKYEKPFEGFVTSEVFPGTQPFVNDGYEVRVCGELVYRGVSAGRADLTVKIAREAIAAYLRRATRKPSKRRAGKPADRATREDSHAR